MKADNINFREFITAGRRTFTIPVYQRNYEWKESECTKLFNDIETIASGSSSHFVGTIVYVTSDSNPSWSEYTIMMVSNVSRRLCCCLKLSMTLQMMKL